MQVAGNNERISRAGLSRTPASSYQQMKPKPKRFSSKAKQHQLTDERYKAILAAIPEPMRFYASLALFDLWSAEKHTIDKTGKPFPKLVNISCD